jgi:hypothetical protein
MFCSEFNLPEKENVINAVTSISYLPHNVLEGDGIYFQVL